MMRRAGLHPLRAAQTSLKFRHIGKCSTNCSPKKVDDGRERGAQSKRKTPSRSSEAWTEKEVRSSACAGLSSSARTRTRLTRPENHRSFDQRKSETPQITVIVSLSL